MLFYDYVLFYDKVLYCFVLLVSAVCVRLKECVFDLVLVRIGCVWVVSFDVCLSWIKLLVSCPLAGENVGWSEECS